ncbi:MAG: transposase family protein [Aureispira sp.]
MPCYQEQYNHEKDQSSYLAADVTEQIIPRKTCYTAQKEDYSGKQHQHTEKKIALCDEYGYIHFLSASYVGSTHDKTLWDDGSIQSNGASLLMDLGFLGAEQAQNNILLSFKRTPNKELGKVKKTVQ